MRIALTLSFLLTVSVCHAANERARSTEQSFQRRQFYRQYLSRQWATLAEKQARPGSPLRRWRENGTRENEATLRRMPAQIGPNGYRTYDPSTGGYLNRPYPLYWAPYSRFQSTVIRPNTKVRIRQ